MNQFSTFKCETITTRIFNQEAKFHVWGKIHDCGRIELTDLAAVGQDINGKEKAINVREMLYMTAIYDAIVSLLNEWTHSLIFTTEQEQTK